MGSKMIDISQLKVTIFVRTSLDEDRVVQLALLYEKDPGLLPALQVNAELEVIDGRHRLEAAKLAGLTQLPCIVGVSAASRGEEIMAALAANMGGSLPPTASDIRLAIQGMLTSGMSGAKIAAGLPLPPSVARKYVTDAQSALAKVRLQRALDAVAHGDIKASDAAEKYNVDVDALRQAVRGKRSKAANDHLGFAALKGGISTKYRSISAQNAQMFGRLMDGYMDGEVSKATILQVIEHCEKMLSQQSARMKDWRQRVEAASKQAAA